MKIILLLLMVFSTSAAISRSIVPEKIITPLLDIFHKKNREVEGGMEVRIMSYNKKGKLRHKRERVIIPKQSYETFQNQASSVYRMHNSDSRGTAFHIGNNLVLTNHHVLSKNMKSTKCGDFTLLERSEKDSFPCKKVHYCHTKLDVCLVEMSPIKKKSGCFFCKKTKYEIALTDGPSLMLRSRYSPTEQEKKVAVLTAIGNTKGLGIHVSQGLGLKKHETGVYFYAPIAGGNSGGALLDDEGIVVGIVRAETIKKIGDNPAKVFNIAAPTDISIRLIREALIDDPETLEKFNQAVIE